MGILNYWILARNKCFSWINHWLQRTGPMHMFLLGFYKSFCKRLNDGVFRGITLSKYVMMIVNLLMQLILFTEYHLPRFLKQNVLFDKLRKYNVSCVYVTFLHMPNVLYTFYIFFIWPNMTKSRICYGVYILALRRLCCFCEKDVEKDDIAEEQAIRSHLVSYQRNYLYFQNCFGF